MNSIIKRLGALCLGLGVLLVPALAMGSEKIGGTAGNDFMSKERYKTGEKFGEEIKQSEKPGVVTTYITRKTTDREPFKKMAARRLGKRIDERNEKLNKAAGTKRMNQEGRIKGK